MILIAALFVNENVEQGLPGSEVGATRMDAAPVARESTDVMVVLDRIVVQTVNPQLAGGPFLVEGVVKQVLFRR